MTAPAARPRLDAAPHWRGFRWTGTDEQLRDANRAHAERYTQLQARLTVGARESAWLGFARALRGCE
jgi:hypothetical protein